MEEKENNEGERLGVNVSPEVPCYGENLTCAFAVFREMGRFDELPETDETGSEPLYDRASCVCLIVNRSCSQSVSFPAGSAGRACASAWRRATTQSTPQPSLRQGEK